jgi:hypothetical protein
LSSELNKNDFFEVNKTINQSIISHNIALIFKIFRLNEAMFYGSHFLNYFSMMLIHDLIFCILYCVWLGGDPIISHFDALLLFFIIDVFSAQMILFCRLITTVFNRPVIAIMRKSSFQWCFTIKTSWSVFIIKFWSKLCNSLVISDLNFSHHFLVYRYFEFVFCN